MDFFVNFFLIKAYRKGGMIVERYALIKAGRMCAKYSHDTGTRKGSRPGCMFLLATVFVL